MKVDKIESQGTITAAEAVNSNEVMIKSQVEALIVNELSKSSTIVTSRDFVITDKDGMNVIDNAGNITLTVRLDSTTNFPINSVIPLKRVQGSTGNVTIAYESGVTGETSVLYTDKDTGSLWKTAANTWELIGFLKYNLDTFNTDITANTTKLADIDDNADVNPTGAEIEALLDTELGNTDWKTGGVGEVNTINSIIAGEPTGSTQVLNIVYMTQAEYNTANTNDETITGTIYLITDTANTFYFGNTVIPNLIINETFDNTSDVSYSGDFAIVGGEAVYTHGGGSAIFDWDLTNNLVAGTDYRFTLDISSVVGNARFKILVLQGASTVEMFGNINYNSGVNVTFTAPAGTNTGVRIETSSVADDFNFDNAVLVQV